MGISLSPFYMIGFCTLIFSSHIQCFRIPGHLLRFSNSLYIYTWSLPSFDGGSWEGHDLWGVLLHTLGIGMIFALNYLCKQLAVNFVVLVLLVVLRPLAGQQRSWSRDDFVGPRCWSNSIPLYMAPCIYFRNT